MSKCVYCQAEILKVEYTIHRDGFGVGPEVPLCTTCGGAARPTCEEIWETLKEQREALAGTAPDTKLN